jgi:hypothetical protein
MNKAAHSVEPLNDDVVTICAISILAGLIADVLHEGVGHALLALLLGANSGVLTTVAWSSAFDSRLVAAGGTLVNLFAGIAFWLILRSARNVSANTRFFLLMGCAFNLFTGTGYFFFSGVTNFGDWADVIAPMRLHSLWRSLLILVGMASYYGAVVLVGTSVVRYLAVPLSAGSRVRRVLWWPYFSAIALSVAGGLLNPIGIQLMWQSALPASAGANSGLLWLRYYVPDSTAPERTPLPIERSYPWIVMSLLCALIFIFVLGRGITLHR